jgi:hypothetical protein
MLKPLATRAYRAAYDSARAVRNGLRATPGAVRATLRVPGWHWRLRRGRFRIGIQTVVVNSFDGHVWGDECMALGLARACEARGHPAKVVSRLTHDIASLGLDVMIAMYPTGEIPGFPYRIELPRPCLNLYWAQVPGHHLLARRDPRFAGFLFASRSEMRASDAPRKLWLPMSADAETYRPVAAAKEFDVVFCANNTDARTPARLARYLEPILAVPGINVCIRGSGWERTPYAAHARGTIHPDEVPRLYAQARLVLSIHSDTHFAADMPTSRLFEAAACGCAVVSDELPTAREIFGDTMAWIDGGPATTAQVAALLRDDDRRAQMGAGARTILLRGYTFEAHAGRVLEFIRSVVAGETVTA